MAISYFWCTSWYLSPHIFKDFGKEFLLFHSFHTFDPYFYFNNILAGDARSEDWKEKHMSLLSSLIAQWGCILHNPHSVLCSLKHQCADCIAQNPCCIIGSVSGVLEKKTSCDSHCTGHGGLALPFVEQYLLNRVCIYIHGLIHLLFLPSYLPVSRGNRTTKVSWF